MTDQAHELRRYARKIAHPAGDVPAAMRAVAADEIERLQAKAEAEEKERDFAKTEIARLHDDIRELTDVRVLDEEDRDLVAWLQGTSAKPAPSFADAYQGAMEEVAIWKKRALEAEDLNRKFIAEINGPTYMGEPTPSGEQDTSVRKAWARFSNELHRSPDAPYPGMSEAFEKHFSQSFTDREWRTESGVWAAAWKAAKNHGAQPAPSVPDITIEMEEAFYEKVTVTRVGSIVGLAEGIKAAMLAAAPETKP